MKYYILDSDRQVREVKNMKELVTNGGAERNTVAKTNLPKGKVSTVFLFIDHSHDREGPPVLWETMVFGGPLDQEQDRCSGTWRDAENMHAKMVERVKAL